LIATGEQSGLRTQIATESVSLCADNKLSAFVELEREVLTVTFISKPFMPIRVGVK
jgi:hypothetical protein